MADMSLDSTEQRTSGGFTAMVIRFYRLNILAVLTLSAVGVWAFVSLPRSEDPEFGAFNSQVVVPFPGADPTSVESLVSRPIEDALSEVAGIEVIESSSFAGLSLTKLEIRDDHVPAEVVEDIRAQIDEIRHTLLPAGITEPEIVEYDTGMIPVMIVSIYGTEDYRVLEQWARRLEKDLEEVAGVAAIDLEGLPRRQISVDVDSRRLAQLRIPLTRISDILGRENASIPGGTLDVGTRRFVIEAPNELRSIDEIAGTVIGRAGDSLVYLSDTATVTDSYDRSSYRVRTNGHSAILLAVVKRQSANTVTVAREVREVVAAVGSTLPKPLSIRIINDRGRNVESLLGNLFANALGGGLLVIVMVSWFLGVRQGLVVSISIPLSVLIALILMELTSIGLNQVSIFGLVLALGMLVDSSLVVVENIERHLSQGKAAFDAVTKAVDEVKTPVLASALTTVAAFLPLLFLDGNLGSFLFALPLTVIFSILGSLVVALTVIPLLSYSLIQWFPQAAIHAGEDLDSPILDRYTELVKAALRNRALTVTIAVLFFVGCLAVIPLLGFQLFPDTERSSFYIDARLSRDATLDTTSTIASQVEKVLASNEMVRDYTTNLGEAGPQIQYNVEPEPARPSFARILVNLDPAIRAEELVPIVRKALHRIAGGSIEAKLFRQGTVGAAAIQIRLMGEDVDTLADISRGIRARIGGISGIVDVHDSLGSKTPRLVMELDRRKAALVDVDSFSFSRTMLMALDGQEATRLRTEDDEIPVVVRLAADSLTEVTGLEGLYFPSTGGGVVPFSEIARVRQTSNYPQIDRRDRKRCVTILANSSGRLADDVLDDIRILLGDLQLPDGYILEYGGEKEERDDSFAGLGTALGLALFLIYILLAIQFNSFAQPMVILLTVPLGVTGAILGLWVTGNPFGFMAFVGVVSLSGIIVNDSIVLTDFANYLQRVENKRLFEALLEAGRTRFRPVMLTSITTIAGLTPLAIWGGSLWSPMACAVIFGLLGATVLILVVLPVVYSLLVLPREGHRDQRFWSSFRRRYLRDESEV